MKRPEKTSLLLTMCSDMKLTLFEKVNLKLNDIFCHSLTLMETRKNHLKLACLLKCEKYL